MGLGYFAEHCSSQIPFDELRAKAWCVAQSGVCCGVCPNTLATIGTRVGSAAVIFFTTSVIVYDGAEAPYNFLAVTLSSGAYLVTIVQAGLRGEQISRFHAYYAMFSGLGFLAPLAAVAFTPNALLYGQLQTRERLLNMTSKTARPRKEASLSHDERNYTHLQHTPSARQRLNPILAMRDSRITDAEEIRPLTATNPFRLATSSTESSPMYSPTARSAAQQALAHDYEKKPRKSVASSSSSMGSLDRLHPLSTRTTVQQSSRPSEGSDGILRGTSDAGNQLTALPERATVSTMLQVANEQSERPAVRKRLQKSQPPSDSRPAGRSRTKTRTKKKRPELSAEDQSLVQRRVHGSSWRRRGYLVGTAALSAAYFTVFILAVATKIFTYSQITCDDPAGTQLLFVAQVAFIGLFLVIGAVLLLNLYNHWLPHTLTKPFIFAQAQHRYQRAIVPGTIAYTIFAVWQTLLWTAYNQAASPRSSLLAADEQATSFATVLSFALCFKPALDLVKSITKHVQLIRANPHPSTAS